MSVAPVFIVGNRDRVVMLFHRCFDRLERVGADAGCGRRTLVALSPIPR